MATRVNEAPSASRGARTVTGFAAKEGGHCIEFCFNLTREIPPLPHLAGPLCKCLAATPYEIRTADTCRLPRLRTTARSFDGSMAAMHTASGDMRMTLYCATPSSRAQLARYASDWCDPQSDGGSTTRLVPRSLDFQMNLSLTKS